MTTEVEAQAAIGVVNRYLEEGGHVPRYGSSFDWDLIELVHRSQRVIRTCERLRDSLAESMAAAEEEAAALADALDLPSTVPNSAQ